MWQRFSENARKTIFYAQEEAQKYGEGYVSTEHILLGLLREEGNMAVRTIVTLGIAPARIREDVKKQLPRGHARPSQDMTLTPRAKRVIDLAYDEARFLNNDYIGTEHLLLGLIREGEGLAGRALAHVNLKIEKTRDAVGELQRQPGAEGAPSIPPRRSGRPSLVPFRLAVNFDFRLLHPVDQMLIGILCDAKSVLGQDFRQRNSSLDWILPSLIATMKSEAEAERPSLDEAFARAREIGEELTPALLYRACVDSTTANVRATLVGLNLEIK